MINLDANVALPNDGGFRRGAPHKYPWAAMQVGDSFFLADKAISSIAPSASIRARTYGEKYTCRSVDGGVRVWKLA